MALDYQQIFKKCFDSTKNALRITGVAGSLDGQITWNSGLGPITHILGPTDQELSISSNSGNTLGLGIDELNVLTLSSTPAFFTNTCVYPVDLDGIAGGADVDIDFTLAGGVITIVFSSGDALIANFAAVTSAEVVDVINSQTTDLVATVAGAQTTVSSAYAAQDWTLEVTGGTAAATLLFPNGIYYGTTIATLMGQLKFGSGLGPMVSHIAGPDDQPFYMSSAAGQDLWLRADGGNEYLVLNSTDTAIDVYNPIHFQDAMGTVDQIVGPSDEALSIQSNEDPTDNATYWSYWGVNGVDILSISGTEANDDTAGAGPWNLSVIAGGGPTTLTVSVNGGGAVTVTFTSTDFTAYNACTRAEIAVVITAQGLASGFYAIDDTTHVTIASTEAAYGSTLRVTGGTAAATLAFGGATQRGVSQIRVAGQIYFPAGMPAGLIHISGPSDNALVIEADANRNCSIGADVTGSGHASLYAAGGNVSVHDDATGAVVTGGANCGATLTCSGTGHSVVSAVGGTITVFDDTAGITAIATANGAATLSTSGTGHATVSSAGGNITVNDDTAGITITATANGAATLTTSGTGHATVSSAGGIITVYDDASGITAIATANGAATLSTSGTGHATVSTANNTLTLNDDAGTGITTSGHLHVGGLLALDAAVIVETQVMQTGTTANVITVLSTDFFIGVDCSGAAKQVNLEAAATAGTGRVLIIKDQSGNAGANPITIDGNGAEHIDESDTYVINSNYGSVTLICTGTATNEWAIV